MKPETSRAMRDIIRLMEVEKLALSKHNTPKLAHCDQRTAQRILGHLWLSKMIRIVSWERTYNNTTPRYRWGKGADAPRPKPMTAAERQRNRRMRPEVREKEAFNKRVKRTLGKEVRLGMFGV